MNKKGMYNRCKLTRMVVDSEWEEQMWKAAWAPREVPAEEECVGDTSVAVRGKMLWLAARRGSSWTK